MTRRVPSGYALVAMAGAVAMVVLAPRFAASFFETGSAQAFALAQAKSAGVPRGERRLVLFYTAEAHGVIEPCGCTSDPLGDVSRLAGLIADTKRTGEAVALVDAGGLLYPDGAISEKERAASDLRAEFIAATFQRMGLIGAAIGETDLARGVEQLQPRPRLAANVVGPTPLVRAARVERVGHIAVGVLGVSEPQVAEAIVGAHGKTVEPVTAVKRDVDRLRAEGAELVILLAPVDKALARKLAREAHPDILILGKRVGQGMARLDRVGTTFLVAPQDEIQQVGRLEIVLRAPAKEASKGGVGAGGGAASALVWIDGGGPEANRLRLEEIKKGQDRLRASLAEWSDGAAGKSGASMSTTDARFVAQKRAELVELESEEKRLQLPWQPPAAGNYLVNELVPMRRRLRQDAATLSGMKNLDRRIASINLKNAAPPPPPEAGRASYVGTQKCASCHQAAQAFWDRTVHAQAWKTLVDGGKQSDYKCIGCHVTGFGQVGGSSLGFTKRLKSVQCETCHGPGSLHVAGEGNEEPLAIRRDTPETTCLGCHTEQHSDTFRFEPYLRDIVGPGHGAKRRAALGPGITGHELRSAALKRARLAAVTSPAPLGARSPSASPSPSPSR